MPGPIEYGLIAALVSVAGIVAFEAAKPTISAWFTQTNTQLIQEAPDPKPTGAVVFFKKGKICYRTTHNAQGETTTPRVIPCLFVKGQLTAQA